MNAAYVDTSCLVAIAFEEPEGRRASTAIAEFPVLIASNLLEAELRAAMAREGVGRGTADPGAPASSAPTSGAVDRDAVDASTTAEDANRSPADPGTAEDLLARLTWLLPDRPLTGEVQRALAAGYLRGADLWHLASALYLSEQPAELPFLTLDERQATVAAALGFPLPLRPEPAT